MKKQKINIRSVIYSLLGVLASTTFVLSILVQVPSVPPARTDIKSFEGGSLIYENKEESEEVENPVKEGVTIGNIKLGDNVHKVTPEVRENLRNAGVFTLGKMNPMLYKENKETPPSGTPVDIEVPETPKENVAPQPTGIKLETPEGVVHLEYTSGVLPVTKDLYKVDRIYGMVGEQFNYGIEIRSEGMANKEVVSVLPGIISNVGSSEEYGNYVVINHGTVSSLYSRLNSPSIVKIGDRVFMGDPIGYIEASEDPHLYFEMDVDGVRFNPEIFINAIKGD